MKQHARRVHKVLCGVLLSLIGTTLAAQPADVSVPPPTQPQASRFEVTDRYTAQRRPRVTVLRFEDTNTTATGQRYGASVEAMLVTYLKRKSQFVVVERKDLSDLMQEKERYQRGMVESNTEDPASRELLEKIDVFVLGSVTLLDHMTSVNVKGGDAAQAAAETARRAATTQEGNEPVFDENGFTEDPTARSEKRASIAGPRVEIDVKLISRFDGRIIAAAQRGGPVACLRSIVERLGVAIEQEFLRPYYGQLKVNLDEPAHIRVFLTPILPENALDEEKPPVELSSTVTIAGDYDVVEPWTTDPTTYTIRNLLSGWYSMRIERPGYASISSANSRWEVRKRSGQEKVYDRVSGRALDTVEPAVARFVVRVDPLDTEVVDGNALGFRFEKEGGSMAPLVQRQYLDKDFVPAKGRVVLMGGRKIEINQLDRPSEYADDERCDLFDERQPQLANYSRTFIARGETFNFDSFTSGELIIEDYRGEVVPVGEYQVAIWEPAYELVESPVKIRANDQKKPFKVPLVRETAGIVLGATGSRAENTASLRGLETQRTIPHVIDFEQDKFVQGVPVDTYLATTDIEDLTQWRQEARIVPKNLSPPVYDSNSAPDQPMLIKAPVPKSSATRIPVKTRFGLGGRLEVLTRVPDAGGDLFVDYELRTILNLLLYGAVEREVPLEPSAFQNAVLGFLESFVPPELRGVAGRPKPEPVVSPPPSPELLPAPVSGSAEKPVADLDRLRQLLEQHLAVLDLVVLDSQDMSQIRSVPEVAGIFSRYVSAGGSLFLYLAEVGDYRPVVATALTIESMSRPSRRLDLSPGEVEGLIPVLSRKDVKVKLKRSLPEVGELSGAWRTLAFTKKGRKPRIVERVGKREGGGHLVVWLDDPASYRGRLGGTRQKVEEVRAGIEHYVLRQARAQMVRRFGETRNAESPCGETKTLLSPGGR
jgi:Curli production assembly/transport component CsgG